MIGSDYDIDLGAVMKAAQAISGEIVLERLIERLMTIALENAGARRGVLLLQQDGELVVRAEQVAGGQPALCCRGGRGKDEPHLPQTILAYVARTDEAVVLRDAAAEGPFTADPYVRERGARSILCASLRNQGKRLAVVYLENALTVGAFTESRVEVLRLLGAQAVLSIQNAMLFESLEEHSRTLEKKVEERTAELTATQKQLLTQEKLASLGALTAGIAHELKNPLNFVNNFAQLSGDLIDELVETLDEDLRIPSDVRRDLALSLAQLRENAQKIGQHGKRADDIINGMLLHSRHASSPRQPGDLNAIVAESVGWTLHALRARDPRSSPALATDYDESLGPVDVVATDVHRVVVNLIHNAAYATTQKRKSAGPGYAPSIHVSTRDLGARAELRIRDNGTGIPPAILDRIYMPFFTTKPSGEGTGLGLSISYDIVTQGHQGELRVESVEGESTEFIVTLPKRAAARA